MFKEKRKSSGILFAAVAVLLFTSQQAPGINIQEVRLNTVRNTALINGFRSNAATYEIINLPREGRTNVIKINGKDCDWAVLHYSLANYRNKSVRISFSADVMRIGAEGHLFWQINNEPEYPSVAYKLNTTQGVWYSMKNTITITPVNKNPVLSLTTWKNNASDTVFYFDNLSVSIENFDESAINVYPIKAPVAGNYPQGLFKYPFRTGFGSMQTETGTFRQTLEWLPAVPNVFKTNTQYTAVLTLEPFKERSFKNITINDIKGLPSSGVKKISMKRKGKNLVFNIVFEKTSAVKAAPQIIFQDEFNGTKLDTVKWETLDEEWQGEEGRASLRSEMISVSGGNLNIRFKHDPELGRTITKDKARSDNWIRSGAVRTRRNYDSSAVIFENSYGYYEARIKFPAVRGAWGGFFLWSTTSDLYFHSDKSNIDIVHDYAGVAAAEIDIVESFFIEKGTFHSGIIWNGYGEDKKMLNSEDYVERVPVNIYDGNFHTFALDWSPSAYIFYADGKEFFRVDGGGKFQNSGILGNPAHIAFSMDSALFLGLLQPDFIEDVMLVDYVRVYNQPPGN